MSHPHLPSVESLPLHQHLGIRLLQASAGRSRIELPVTAVSANVQGVLHGGVIYAVCDIAAYAALLSVLPDDEAAVTHDIHVSCMRPAPLGSTLSVEAWIVKQGRSLVFLEAQAHVAEKLVASARITKSIVRSRA